MALIEKNWDRHVAHAEEIARSRGFLELRDAIVALAEPTSGDRVLDIGSGTGLLTLELAPRVQIVWALDISPAMCEYLRTKAASAELENVEPVVGSAASLPLMEDSVDLVVSNYCFHHLSDPDKVKALEEVRRVLRPGGALVFGDMMFRPSVGNARDRGVVIDKVRALLRRGPAGVIRLLKNALRYLTGGWEKPARADWWERVLGEAGFEQVRIETRHHEGGVAYAVKPASVPVADATDRVVLPGA
jgi:ubiquinone/menaquinone biosynthesis C-methylase UbiE